MKKDIILWSVAGGSSLMIGLVIYFILGAKDGAAMPMIMFGACMSQLKSAIWKS